MCRDASCRCVVSTSATPGDGVREEGISSSLGGSERILRRALHDFSNRRRKHHSVARPPARASIETRGRRARPNERAILSFRHTPRVSSIASIVFERYPRAKPNTRLDEKNVRVVLARESFAARPSRRPRDGRFDSTGGRLIRWRTFASFAPLANATHGSRARRADLAEPFFTRRSRVSRASSPAYRSREAFARGSTGAPRVDRAEGRLNGHWAPLGREGGDW